jgi:ketosteroid isomerase-like protein
MSTEQNRATAIKFITTMEDHVGFDESLVTDDFVWWSPGFGEFSREKFKRLVPRLEPIMPKRPHMTIVGVAADGDRVAVETTGQCILASGRDYRNTYHFVLLFENGLVKMLREYVDTKLVAEIFGGH